MDHDALRSLRQSLADAADASPPPAPPLTRRLATWLAGRPAAHGGAGGSPRAPQSASPWPRLAERLADPDEPSTHPFLPEEAVLATFGPRRDAFGQRSAAPEAAAAAPAPARADPARSSAAPDAEVGVGDQPPPLRRIKFAAAAADTPFFDGDLDDDAATQTKEGLSRFGDADRRSGERRPPPLAAAQQRQEPDPTTQQAYLLAHLAASLASNGHTLQERLDEARQQN